MITKNYPVLEWPESYRMRYTDPLTKTHGVAYGRDANKFFRLPDGFDPDSEWVLESGQDGSWKTLESHNDSKTINHNKPINNMKPILKILSLVLALLLSVATVLLVPRDGLAVIGSFAIGWKLGEISVYLHRKIDNHYVVNKAQSSEILKSE